MEGDWKKAFDSVPILACPRAAWRISRPTDRRQSLPRAAGTGALDLAPFQRSARRWCNEQPFSDRRPGPVFCGGVGQEPDTFPSLMLSRKSRRLLASSLDML